MEKRNVVEPRRTPCRKQTGGAFCDCSECQKKTVKKAADQSVNINDIEGLARVHK